MKYNKFFGPLMAAIILIAGMAVLPVQPARAQNGLDFFGLPRTLQVTPCQTVSATASNMVDVSMFKGVCKLDLTCITNAGCTVTCTISSSPDQTNWTAVTYALATASTQQYTNRLYSGTLYGTNKFLLPGTITTPVAATAGWATPYLVPAPVTNTAAITMTAGGTWSIGFNVDDAQRYLSVLWTIGGSNAATCSATLTGRADYVP
jgi:hypothetical protein